MSSLLYRRSNLWWQITLAVILGLTATFGVREGCASEPAGRARKAGTGELGLNLGSVVDWSPELVFVDIFKQSRIWISQAEGKEWGKGGDLALNNRGEVTSLRPGQFAETLLFTGLAGHYPGGNYLCLYDGKGNLEFSDAGRVIDSQPGRLVVKVEPEKGEVHIRLRKTDDKDPVRNIRLIMPGFEETYFKEPFHPAFLKRLQGFKTLRFMDWGRTNNSKVEKWAERTPADAATQTLDSGVALEYQIALANTLGLDPWFCIPHRAGDDYVLGFAKLLKEKLDPARKFYLEFSNETWNGGFEQARYCQTKGKELGLSGNDFEAQLRYSSQRSVEIFEIVEKEFGGHDRFVRVLAAQSANPWTGTTEMDWKDASKKADAIAIAPYFGNAYGDPKTAEKVAGMGVDAIVAGCEKAIAANKELLGTYAREAHKRGLQLLAYESGQHLVGYGGAENNDKLTQLFLKANRDLRMKDLYLRDLSNWQEAGGGVNCLFSSMGGYSKWGSWGLLEWHDQDESTAPKWQAVREFMKK